MKQDLLAKPPVDIAATVRIREAKHSDISAMFAVRAAVAENRATRAELEASGITDAVVAAALGSTLKAWVAETSDRIVAFSIANYQRGCVWALFVEPDFQRRGIGTCLLQLATNCLGDHGFLTAFLTTDASTSAYQYYLARRWTHVSTASDGSARFELSLTD
jgi:GNAT superfamily N-acetyltransferase